MSIKKKLFGKLADGTEVYRYTLKNKNGMKMKVMTYGGTVTELWVPDKNGTFTDIIGGFDSLQNYIDAPGSCQGALIGRWANRIGKGQFEIDGQKYQLGVTASTGNHCHGGPVGFNKRIWTVEVINEEEPEIALHLFSPDGDQDFPGNLTVTVTYKLTNENSWYIRYVATTDEPTIINLTQHAYFNLKGYAGGTIHDTELMIDADTYLETDCNLLPTGVIKNVEGTPFDFRTPKAIGRDLGEKNDDLLKATNVFNGYDHCFNFSDVTRESKKRAVAYDAKSGRVLEMYTNQPCVQLYTGNFLNDEAHPFKGGYNQSVQTLFCLETQCMPDSMNHEGFTNGILRPGEVYDYVTEYKFSVK